MPLMRSPDGEVADVPVSEMQHYQSLGATVAGAPPTSQEYMDQRGPRAPFQGSDEGLVQPPWYADPVDWAGAAMAGPVSKVAPMLRGGGAALRGGLEAGMGAIENGAAMAGKVAGAPFIKRIPGARMVRGMAEDVAAVAAKRAGKVAPEVSAGAMEPLVGGAEAAAYREGGQAGLDAARAAEATQKAIPKGKTIVSEHFRSLPKKGKPGGPPRSNSKLVKSKPKGPPGTAKPRHQVQYFSKSRGEHIDIEGMNQKHIEQAYRKLAATNPKPGSVARRQMDALMDETKHRALDKGVHIGQAEPKGPPGTSAAERAASNRQAAKNLRRHPAANEKTGAAVERTVVSPDQVAKSAKIQTWMDQQGLDPAAQAEMWRQILAGGLSP